MAQIILRDQWYGATADRRRFSRLIQPARIKGVALHYPGDGAKSRANPSVEDTARVLRGFRDYHRRVRKWPDIGYNLLVDQAGRLAEGAGFRVAAHSATKAYPLGNHEWIGVQLVVGNNETPSDKAIETVRWLRVALVSGELGEYLPGWQPLPNAHALSSHRRMPGASTQCPGAATEVLIDRGAFSPGTISRDPPTGGRLVPEDGHFGAVTVKALQKALLAIGEDVGPVDGHFGPRSIRAYQRVLKRRVGYAGLIDGDFGCMTIAAEQRWLWALGLYGGRIDCDRGAMTVKALQRALNQGRIT
jgi:hypothetical protein